MKSVSETRLLFKRQALTMRLISIRDTSGLLMIVVFLFLMTGRKHSGANRLPQNRGRLGEVSFQDNSSRQVRYTARVKL